MTLIAVANGFYDTGDGQAHMVSEGEVVADGSPAADQCADCFEDL